MKVSNFAFVFGLVLAGCCLSAAPIVIDFEGLTDLTAVTTQYTGVTFSNTQVLTAGGALNDFSFPPFSGINVVAGTGAGPLTAVFTNPITSFQGYFTYSDSTLQIKAYDSLNQLLTTVTPGSGCDGNYVGVGGAGCNPNELITVSGVGNIASITVSSNSSSADFTVDNFTYTPADVVTPPDPGPTDPAVPEPGTVTLIGAGLALAAWKARRK